MFISPSFRPSQMSYMGAGVKPSMHPLFASPKEHGTLDVRGTPLQAPSERVTNKVTHIGDGGIATRDIISCMQFVTPCTLKSDQPDTEIRKELLAMFKAPITKYMIQEQVKIKSGLYLGDPRRDHPSLHATSTLLHIVNFYTRGLFDDNLITDILPTVMAPPGIQDIQVSNLQERVFVFIYNVHNEYRSRATPYNHAEFYSMPDVNNIFIRNAKPWDNVERALQNLNLNLEEAHIYSMYLDLVIRYYNSVFLPWGPAIQCDKRKMMGSSKHTPTYMLNAFVGGLQAYADTFIRTNENSIPMSGSRLYLITVPFVYQTAEDITVAAKKVTVLHVLVVDTGVTSYDASTGPHMLLKDNVDKPFNLDDLRNAHRKESERFCNYVRKVWRYQYKRMENDDSTKISNIYPDIRDANVARNKSVLEKPFDMQIPMYPLGVMVEDSHRASRANEHVTVKAHFDATTMSVSTSLRASTS